MTDQTVVPAPAPAPASPEPTPQAPRKGPADYAREVFGKEYFGKAAEEPKPETEETKPVDAQAGEEVPPKEEPTEGGEPEEGKEPAPAEPTSEMPIATVAELVEHLETNPEWFNSLKMSFNVDGMPTEATIKDLVDSYQLREAAEHRLEKAKTIIQEQAEAWNAKQAQADQQLHVLGAFIQDEETKLAGDIATVDPKLRMEDPAEWSARMTEFDQRRAHIGQLKANAIAQWQENQTARAAEAQRTIDQYRESQRPVLLELIPEWRDAEGSKQERAEVHNFLLHYGYHPKEIEDVVDPRHFAIARKAMLYDKSRGQVDTAKKRVATVPKIMKPGAPKAKEQLASERLAALHAKMVQSGHQDDALAYRLAKRGAR